MTALLPPPALFMFDMAPIHSAHQAIITANNWQEKYRQIMLLAKHIPQLADEWKQDNAKVNGCESQAWLYHHCIDNHHYWLIDSDARIVKGLAGLLLAQLQGKTEAEIAGFDTQTYFAALGLAGQLSPSRTGGLTAMAAKMLTGN